MKKLVIAAIIVTFGLATTVMADDGKLPPASTKTGVTYAKDIKPIFDAACLKCHDSKKPKQSAKLSLDTLDGILKGGKDGKIIVVGDSTKGDLISSIAHLGDPMAFMPKKAKQLTPEQIGLIRAWIDQGAK